MISQQLVTILGVVVGAVMSFLGTMTIERHRRRVERSKRWNELQLQVYLRHLSLAQRVVAFTRTIVLTRPTGEDRKRVHVELDAAHMDRTISSEDIRVLAPPKIVEAAYELNRSVWGLQDFARGEQSWDEQVWRQRYDTYIEQMFGFEKAVRAELQVPGEIPHPPRPPEWFLRRRG